MIERSLSAENKIIHFSRLKIHKTKRWRKLNNYNEMLFGLDTNIRHQVTPNEHDASNLKSNHYSREPSASPSSSTSYAHNPTPSSKSSKHPKTSTSARSNRSTKAPKHTKTNIPTQMVSTASPSSSPSYVHTHTHSRKSSKLPRSRDNKSSKSSKRTNIPSQMISTGTPSLAPSYAHTLAPSSKSSKLPRSRSDKTSKTSKHSKKSKTNHPTTQPSTAPTPCNGFRETKPGEFGNTRNKNAIIVKYRYEIESDPSIYASLLWDILPSIESNLSIFLMQDLLPPCQGEERKLDIKIIDGKSRRLVELIGISGEPMDVLDTSLCQSVSTKGNECAQIKGYISVYLEGDTKNAEIEILSLIRKIMEEDRLLSSHEAIVKIAYVSQDSSRKEEEYINSDIGKMRVVGLAIGVVAGLITSLSLSLRFIMKEEKRGGSSNDGDLSSRTPSDWTEVVDSSFVNSSHDSNISDDETVLRSNRRKTRTGSDEIIVDFEIENDENDQFFDVLFDEKQKKSKNSDSVSEIGD